MTDDMRTALDERQQLIERRAVDRARTALTKGDAWTRHLGPPPTEPTQRQTWFRDLATVAAYRDRHAITGDTPVDPVTVHAGQPDAQIAYAAVSRAHRLARLTTPDRNLRPSGPSRAPELGGPAM